MASANIATLNVLLTGSMKGLSSTLNAAGGALDSFAGKVASVGSAIGKIGAVAGGAAIAGLAALGGWGIKLAADAEQAKVAFGVMLGSADKAKALLGDINAFAASTPFETTELVGASKALLAFGVSQEQIIPTMRHLGDLASGLNVPLNDLAQIYGKAKVAGRLMAEDVNQLTERGVPVIKEFAKQFGVTEGEVKKLVEEGKIGFPQLQKAIVALTTDGGKFAGMMEAQSQTLAGLWSTLTDTISMKVLALGNLLVEKFNLKGIIAGASIAFEALGSAVLPLLESMIGKLSMTGATGGKAADYIVRGVEMIAKGFSYLLDAFDWVRIGLKTLQWGFMGLAQGAISAFMSVQEAVAWVINKAIDGVNLLIEQLNKLPKVDIPSLDVEVSVNREQADLIVKEFQKSRDALAQEVGKLQATDRQAPVTKFFDDVRKRMADAQNVVPKPAEVMKIDEGFVTPNKELEKANKELDKQAEKWRDKIKTPLQEAQEELGKLVKLYEAGKLSAAEFGAAQKVLEKEFTDKLGKDAKASFEAPKLLSSTSREGMNLVNEIQARTKGISNKVPEQQLAELRKQTEHLQVIADNKAKGSESVGLATISV